jgi:hypothetical protein
MLRNYKKIRVMEQKWRKQRAGNYKSGPFSMPVGLWQEGHEKGRSSRESDFDRNFRDRSRSAAFGIIEMARKTPADLGRPRDISACLIYWKLYVSSGSGCELAAAFFSASG